MDQGDRLQSEEGEFDELLVADFGGDALARRMLIPTLVLCRAKNPHTWGLLTLDLLYMIVDLILGRTTLTNWRGPALLEQLTKVPTAFILNAFRRGVPVHSVALAQVLARGIAMIRCANGDHWIEESIACKTQVCWIANCEGCIPGRFHERGQDQMSLDVDDNGLCFFYKIHDGAYAKAIECALRAFGRLLCPRHVLMFAGLVERPTNMGQQGTYLRMPLPYGHLGPHLCPIMSLSSFFYMEGRTLYQLRDKEFYSEKKADLHVYFKQG